MVIFKDDVNKQIREDYNNYLTKNDEYDEGNITKTELESIITSLKRTYKLHVPDLFKRMDFDYYRILVLESFEEYCRRHDLTIN